MSSNTTLSPSLAFLSPVEGSEEYPWQKGICKSAERLSALSRWAVMAADDREPSSAITGSGGVVVSECCVALHRFDVLSFRATCSGMLCAK